MSCIVLVVVNAGLITGFLVHIKIDIALERQDLRSISVPNGVNLAHGLKACSDDTRPFLLLSSSVTTYTP